MKESNDIFESVSNKSIRKGSESKDIKEPIYEMTIESEKGRKEIINIYSDSKPEEIAYNFCKENNLDFETLELMTNQIKKLMKIITNKKEEKQKNNVENENKLFDCNEPILEDSEEQQSVSAEKIMKTKSFKENIMKKKDKNLNKNLDNNNKIEVDKINVDNNFKIDGNFKEKQKNSKTSTIITNTINNCMEIIEKEEKYITSSSSTFSSKIGVSSIHNKQYSLNSKENIPLSDFCKEKEKIDEEINKKNIQSFSYSNNNNHNINQSKSFVNRIPKSTRNDLNINSGNMNDANNNSNYNIKQKINNIEIDSNIKTESEEYKNSYKIKSLKNSHINNKLNSLDSTSGYEYYCNKQKEIIKNNKKKSFQRIINMIKKNNIDINQLSTESLTKSNNLSKKKKIEYINNEKKIKNKPNGIINQKNNIYFGINNKRNNLRINSINSNYIKNSNGVYYDTNDKDQLYSLSKNEDTSTLNNIIKNSVSINNNYFSNLNSIKHEINMTILSKPKKQIINVPTPKNRNNIIIIKNYNKKNNRNCHTLTEGNINMKCSSQDKIKDFKKKIFNSKSKNTIIKNNNNNNKSKSKKSPVNKNSKINKIKKNYNSTNNNIELNYPLLTKQFFNVTNLKKYRNNFRSPQHKANTMKTTMKNFIIKNSKTNMNKDSFFNNNNKILLSQSSRINNINDYSSYIKQRCNSFNDFNSNINNIFINLKYSNNKKNKSLLGYLDNNSGTLPQQNKKKINKKRNNSHVFSSNRIYNNNTNSFGNKKSVIEASDKALINNMNLNLNITAEANNNSYSFKNKRKINNNNFANLKNKIINKCSTNINNKRPCYFFVESQNSSSHSTSRGKIKKNHNTLLKNSSLTINLLKKNKIVEALKEIFYYLSNNSDKIDVLKINKKNLIIPEEIIKPIQKIIRNCKSKNNNIIIKDFILKGVLLFDSLPFEEKISILNSVQEEVLI